MMSTKPPQRRRAKREGDGGPRRRVVVEDGARMVMLPEREYDRLLHKADEWEPVLPEPDAAGLYPALETLAAIQARDILRARRRLGLTQAELARRAGVRPETLNRLEHGKHRPNVATMGKIDRALKAAEAEDSPYSHNQGDGGSSYRLADLPGACGRILPAGAGRANRRGV
jgi:DNA-binding XRE family transcriptional regulator